MHDDLRSIATAAGIMPTWVYHPDGAGPYPLVVFLMDAPGLRLELQQMAARLAGAGYYVMLPDLYYRQPPMVVVDREQMYQRMNALTNALVCADISELIRHADSDSAASTSAIACIGYCMSGPFAFAAASAFADQVAAMASLHGVRLFHDGPDSPHLGAAEVRAELYFGCAQYDDWAPSELIAQLDQHLRKVGVRYQIEWYPDTQHGFVFPQRQGVYQAAAAEHHWRQLLALLQRNLPGDLPSDLQGESKP